jgi:protease-4
VGLLPRDAASPPSVQAMKRYPITTALLLLLGICAVFFALVLALGYLGEDYPYGIGGEKIGIIKIEGTIVESESTIEKIVKYRKNSGIKAIILRINSPGGVVAPPQEIYQEIKKTSEEKPVIVSVESVAASGGYYIACAADMIVSNPGSLVGSIGVMIPIENIEDLLQKVGLKSKIIKSGKYKDIGSMTRPMTGEEEAILQELIDDSYNQFVDAVAEGRKMKREEVLQLADGRVFTGAQAVKLGLIDKLGNLQDAIDIAAGLVGIEGEPQVVYPKKERPSILDFIFEQTAASIARVVESVLRGVLTGALTAPAT